MKVRGRFWHVVLVLAGGLAFGLAVYPLLRPYPVAGHSTYLDMIRAEAFHHAVAPNNWTPRWLPDLYYRHGSPVFNYYAPLSHYVIEVFRELDTSSLWAHKLTFLLFWLLGTIAVGDLTRRLFPLAGLSSAVAAALAYALAPYLLIDAYVRSGIAEFAAFALLPLALLGAWHAARRPGAGAVLAGSLSAAGLIISHNVGALISFPFVLLFGLASAPDRRQAVRFVGALAVGAGLATFFWLPAWAERDLVHAQQSLTGGFFDYRLHFLSLPQLFGIGEPFTFTAPPARAVRFTFGAPLFLAILGGVSSLLPTVKQRLRTPSQRSLLALTSGAICCLLMSLEMFRPVWSFVPALGYVQFPWRFLLPASVLAAPLLGTLPAIASKAWRGPIALLVIVAIFLTARPYLGARYAFHDLQTNQFVVVPVEHLREAVASRRLLRSDRFLDIGTIRRFGLRATAGHEFLPVMVAKLPELPPVAAVQALSSRARVLRSRWLPSGVRACVKSATPHLLAINQFWFPGWRVLLGERELETAPEPAIGRILVQVPDGEHCVEAFFGPTPLRLAALLLSAGFLLLLTLWSSLELHVERARTR